MMSFFCVSCYTTKQNAYLQDVDRAHSVSQLTIKPKNEPVIKPSDLVYIKILTFEEKTYNFFNAQARSNADINSTTGAYMVSYEVDKAGFIDFPFVGHLYVKDMTVSDAQDLIKRALSEYIDQTAVIIKLVNRNITVLGEVKNPGRYPVINEPITIFDAIGMAGDLTKEANAKKLTLVRQIDSTTTTFNNIDLTNKNIVQTDFFYIQNNDIIYIEPVKKHFYDVESFNYQAFLSVILASTFVLYLIK